MNSKLLELSNCTLGYSDGVILKDLSWIVERGDKWAVVGPNGAGKTTLIRTILGLVPLLSGQLAYYQDGVLLNRIPNIGYLPQINNIDKSFPISVEEVIRSGFYGSLFSKEEEQKRLEEMLTAINLLDYRKQAIGKLSGGQLQRVLLARAIASKPDLLVLDEPTSFLDKIYKQQFMTLLMNLIAPETTLIMVTHDLPPEEESQWKILSLGQF